MTKIRKILAVIMTAAVICLAGCKSTTEGIIEEPEVDYVDEDGYIYYKNPTIWTTEKVFEELTINGQKFTSPLNLEKLGEGYSYSTDGAFYDENTRTTCLRLMYKDKSLAWVYLDDCDSIEDISNKDFNCIAFSVNSTSEEYINNVSISGLSIGSDVNDIMALIGIPIELSADKRWFSYGDHNDNITLNVTQDDSKVIYICVYLIKN